MAEENRRETDAQVLRLFGMCVVGFIAIGLVVYSVF